MKRIIKTVRAPQAIGPYSQAVEINGMLFVSGQIAIDPGTGKLIDGDISQQTELVMKNIGAVLNTAGYSYSDVVKSTCLLINMDDFDAMNKVYAKYYSENPPARAAFEASKLPKGAMVEIETIAVK